MVIQPNSGTSAVEWAYVATCNFGTARVMARNGAHAAAIEHYQRAGRRCALMAANARLREHSDT